MLIGAPWQENGFDLAAFCITSYKRSCLSCIVTLKPRRKVLRVSAISTRVGSQSGRPKPEKANDSPRIWDALGFMA